MGRYDMADPDKGLRSVVYAVKYVPVEDVLNPILRAEPSLRRFSLLPPTAEVRIQSRVGPCGICGGQSGTGTGIPPITSVFPC
jgi:hypothetical protein